MERTNGFINIEIAKKLLGTDPYLLVNKRLLILYKPNVVIFLTNLIDFSNYLQTIKKTNGDWFYCTHEQQQQHVKLSLEEIRTCKKLLLQDKIISVQMKGLPPKEWYKINYFNLFLKLDEIKTLHQFIGNHDELTSTCTMNNINPNNINILSSISSKTNNLPLINTSHKNGYITLDHFEEFWKRYPKKASKGDAKTAWEKLCKNKDRPLWKDIRLALSEHKESEQWTDPNYIPNASTWLNNKRWLNDASKMKRIVDYNKKKEDEIKRKPKKDYMGRVYNWSEKYQDWVDKDNVPFHEGSY